MTGNSTAAARSAKKPRKNEKGERHSKLQVNEDKASNTSDADDWGVPSEYQYKRPKPKAVSSALFMWDEVASFTQPKQVLKMEHVCQDVRRQLQMSSAGTRTMNRYWNARWTELVWEEGDAHLSEEKRYLYPSSLKRSEGKKNWRKMYREEYPLWVQRTFQGKGIKNNAINEAKIRFHKEELNAKMTAEQLAKLQLTEEEAIAKAARKRGVEIEVDAENGTSGGGGGNASHHQLHNGNHKDHGVTDAKKAILKRPMKDASLGLSREDYKMDKRQCHRKDKHQKGRDKKWSGYAAMDDAW